MMSNGLGHVLPNIFSDGQTFCIVGKDIAETLASIRDVTDIDEMKGYILKIIGVKSIRYRRLFKKMGENIL